MHELLQQHISRYVSLPQQDMHTFLSTLELKKLRRRQYLLQEGDICRKHHFVLQGGLRQYEMDQTGKENIINFGFEDWWITDRYSLLTATPSIYNIEALEDTTILQIENTRLEQLFLEIPLLERYFHKVLQEAFAGWQGRIRTFQKSAEERYREFLHHYGHREQRLSQQHIASYLGVSRETLSRIRSQWAGN